MVYHLYSLIFVLSLLPTVDCLRIRSAQSLSLRWFLWYQVHSLLTSGNTKGPEGLTK
jgi:hypothetical protein